MNWHDRMNRVIEYIENNLSNKIDLEYAAKIAYQSVTSFQRMFSIVVEMPVSEYIRRRRMSLAALEFQNSEAKVIDISLKYGYDSPDAFTRAFKEIYGISPSVARSEGIPLKPFPRISFQLTIKGDVIMEKMNEKSGPQIINTYYEQMPPLRLIGKRYTSADLDGDGWFESKWNEWSQNGWYGSLFAMDCIPGYENTIIFAIENASQIAWWIGAFFPVGTAVAEDFSYVDIPAGIVGMTWIRGYRHSKELFTHSAHNMCVSQWQETGNTVKLDFNGELCKWSFERYDNIRFFVPDSDGKVTMDFGVYLVESEISEQALLNVENSEVSIRQTGSANGADTEQEHFIQPPQVKILGVAPYSVDVESNLLFCALSTLFLKLKNCSEATPYFCSMKKGICSNCGDCGKKSNLAKHQLNLYHFLLTATGVGLMVEDPNETGAYDLKNISGIITPLLEDRLDFAMKAEGFTYRTLDKTNGENELFQLITVSIQQDRPVLMKLDDGPEWCVVIGFDLKTGAIYGLDARNHHIRTSNHEKRSYTEDGLFVLTDWFEDLQKVVIVTGKTEKFNFSDIIERIVMRLKLYDGGIKSIIPQMIDSLTLENSRGVALYLNNIAGYMVEARWHAAECFASSLMRHTDDETAQSILGECAGIYFDTHDTCWQIWGQLGVGSHTEYRLPNLINQMMLDKTRQEKLKELFSRIWDNDRAVWEKLSLIL